MAIKYGILGSLPGAVAPGANWGLEKEVWKGEHCP